MKYKPDLVLACYDSRDIFENWSPPDQVVTNVRPSALHLPGGKLIIDSSQVTRWMGSPRGKFMLATTWLRQHSRIAGLLSALDLEWSQHNPWYRAMIDAFAHPVKARNEFKQAIAGLWSSGPSFQIKFFEQATPQQPRAEQAHVFNSASGNETLGKNALLAGQLYAGKANSPDKKPAQVVLAVNSTGAGSMTAGTQKAVATPSSGVNTYKALVTRTLKSLYAEMKSECQRGGAAFAVVALPVRSQLCPLIGTETEFAGIDYAEELQIVEAVCREEHIPMANVEKDAESLSYPQREKLFYTVHLTPQGQRFIADAIQPFVRDQLSRLP
jgi:lysophospholipase L1-like esterase